MFLRTAVVAEPGETRHRIGSALNGVESISTNLPSIEELTELLDRRPLDLVVIDESLLPKAADDFIRSIGENPDPPHVYVEHYRALAHSDVTGISKQAMECLSVYPWPGNIRELANASSTRRSADT